MPGQEEDAFEVFQDRIGGQPVGLCGGRVNVVVM